MKKGIDPHCRAFQTAIEVLGRPWTGLILSMLDGGPLRFKELEERARGLGAKTLSARLKDLEARGLIDREVEGGPPVRVRYTLTSRGRAFGRVAEAIQRWGGELVAGGTARMAPARPSRARSSKKVLPG